METRTPEEIAYAAGKADAIKSYMESLLLDSAHQTRREDQARAEGAAKRQAEIVLLIRDELRKRPILYSIDDILRKIEEGQS